MQFSPCWKGKNIFASNDTVDKFGERSARSNEKYTQSSVVNGLRAIFKDIAVQNGRSKRTRRNVVLCLVIELFISL